MVCVFVKYKKAVEFTLPMTATLEQLKACIRKIISGNVERLKVYLHRSLL